MACHGVVPIRPSRLSKLGSKTSTNNNVVKSDNLTNNDMRFPHSNLLNNTIRLGAVAQPGHINVV